MRTLTTCFLMATLAISSFAQANDLRFHPHNLFIKMKEGEALVKSPLILESKKVLGQLYLVRAKSAQALAKELQGAQGIEYVQKDSYSEKEAIPEPQMDIFNLKNLPLFDFSHFNDPYVNKLWAFSGVSLSGKPVGLDVVSAYDSFPRTVADEVIVAVVDTGVDVHHEDLKDVVWTNPGEVAGDGIDNDRNGYIDDVYGINTLIRDSSNRATVNIIPEGGGGYYHGTHVAGTIAATQNNKLGIAGVANNVKLMSIRTVPNTADELDSDIVEAFVYAAKHGARIINCSFGKKRNEGGMVVRDIINEIGKRYGVLVIASAGNDYQSNNDVVFKYPASFDSENLLVIASSDKYGNLSSFSNVGKLTVDVASPGSDIYSTMPGNKYGTLSGTSMAAPNAAGVAAMVLGFYPELSAVELKKVLMNTTSKVPQFKNKMVSGGLLNLKNALSGHESQLQAE